MIKKLYIMLFMALVVGVGAFFVGENDMPDNFRDSKALLTKVWKMSGFNKDFYCQAPFSIESDSIHVLDSPAYTPRNAMTKKKKINKRAQIIEFEHIMPAHNFGRHLKCWREGGRSACKKDAKFNKMEADLYNLVPAIGEINGDRNNFRYAEPPRNLAYTQYGACRVYSDFKGRRFYPAEYSRGLIARTYLYMSEKYDINLSDSERKLMQAWDKTYPPNDYEIERNAAIKKALWLNKVNKILAVF